MWVTAVVAVVPCQCFTPGGMRTTSPGFISCTLPPHCCTQPAPAVTMSVCPAGWVCHAERAPGSNVTLPPDVRDGAVASNSGSIRTEPVNHSALPLADGCEPLRTTSTVLSPRPGVSFSSSGRAKVTPRNAAESAAAQSTSVDLTMSFISHLCVRSSACDATEDRIDRSFAPRVPYSLAFPPWYCSSVTCSIQSTVFPSRLSWIAVCVIAVFGAAPCQCFSPGGNHTTSPGRSSSIGPPQRWARPKPAVTMSVCPSGWVCHAVRAPGSNVTLAPDTLAGSGA